MRQMCRVRSDLLFGTLILSPSAFCSPSSSTAVRSFTKARGREKKKMDESEEEKNTWTFSFTPTLQFFILPPVSFVPNLWLICVRLTLCLSALLPPKLHSLTVHDCRLLPCVSPSPVWFYICPIHPVMPLTGSLSLHCRCLTVLLSSHGCCSILIWLFCSEKDAHMLSSFSWLHFPPLSIYLSVYLSCSNKRTTVAA